MSDEDEVMRSESEATDVAPDDDFVEADAEASNAPSEADEDDALTEEYDSDVEPPEVGRLLVEVLDDRAMHGPGRARLGAGPLGA